MPGDAHHTATTSVLSLVEPAPLVGPATTCAEVDRSFRNHWTAPSILVAPRGPAGGPGLVSRDRFLTTMAGSYGYGRSLWGKRPIGDLAEWDAPALRATATLGQAAVLLTDGTDGYRDLVVLDEEDHPVGIVRPVRIMQALADRTARQAATDHLTGVASRSRLVEVVEERLADLERDGGAVVVAYVDLDRLKAVNDSVGHSWGDALLRSVAQRIGNVLRPGDVVGRIGGDEFAVVRVLPAALAPDADQHALELGEELCAAVADCDPSLPTLAQSRASVGVAAATSVATSFDALLNAADEAMYAAKIAGGGRVRASGSVAMRPGAWAESRHLEVVYQPIVDTEDHQVVAVEALLRQRTPEGGMEGPVGVLEEAARAGLALDLDRWVLERACTAMVRWDAELGDGAPLAVHVNVAPESLCHPALAESMVSTVDASGLSRARVRLELSERAGVRDLTEALESLEAIARSGIGIALDDLGMSLDTLRILDRLPIDAMKIDRSVVVGAGSRAPVDTAVLSLLVALGRQLGLELVGEGVEQPAEEDTLSIAGVHLMQGFRYSHPVPAAEITERAQPSIPAPRGAVEE